MPQIQTLSSFDAATRDVLEAYDKHVLGCYGPRPPRVFVKGEGCRLWDTEGYMCLDMGGGIAVNCLGHAHPRVGQAISDQAKTLAHVSNLYYSAPQAKLAARLNALLAPGRVFFCNSGAEANEALFKLARRAGASRDKYEILTCEHSFHGRTLACIAATGNPKVQIGFGPPTPGFKKVPYNDIKALEAAITDVTIAV
jgi:acetylornithine/succinyldiaminopimelate/putrescine aminotransferase